MTVQRHNGPGGHYSRQDGFSLIELMVAMTIGLILLAGVIMVVSNSSRSQQEIEKAGSRIENGRFALEMFEREVSHAGYYGEFYDIDPPSSMPDPCSTSLTEIDSGMGLPIQGYSGSKTAGNPAPSCLSDADHRDKTDILVLRRASTATTAIGSLANGEVYLQGLSVNKIVAQADGSETTSSRGLFTLTKLNSDDPANIRKLKTHIYFVGPDDDGVPTLKRLSLVENSGNLTFREEPLATGVEELVVEYGIDGDGDGTATTYVQEPGTVSEWADVVALHVRLIVRGRKPTNGYTDDKTYDLGLEGEYTPDATNYRRNAFVSTTRAANPSMRRE